MLEVENTASLRYLFYGYVAAFVSSIYGHRTGVLANMTVPEVQAARDAAGHPTVGYVINVREHKTNRAFGMAQLFLEPEEFSWFERWLRLRTELETDDNLFFTTGTPDNARTLLKNFQAAWREMELDGTPTFTDIRTAVATHVSAAALGP